MIIYLLLSNPIFNILPPSAYSVFPICKYYTGIADKKLLLSKKSLKSLKRRAIFKREGNL